LRATLAPAIGVVLGPPLGDVVQEDGHVERFTLLDAGHQLGGQRMLALAFALVDARQHRNGADQVLVDRVVMIHVELHHRDDLAEFRNEAAQNPGLVHPP
jgi:hypothetical protein